MAKRITGSTPKLDGYRMPAEFEPQAGVWMLWPERNDNWRDGAKPAQKAFLDVATAILQFEPVTVCVSPAQYQNARERLPRAVRVVEMASNDAWIRDCGPTFLVNDNGGVRAVDWTFNAWGGLVDGLYFPWDLDDQVAQKVCEIERVDSYRTEGFVLEGGSIHVDGEGTVLTTEMCLLSRGRNPGMSREEIERKLCDYLGCEKVLWLRDGIDPEETNGHIDDVACFIRPGEVACIWTDDPQNPFYQPARDAYDTLSQATDARGRKLKVHKLCLTQQPCLLQGAATIDAVEGTIPREDGEVAIASYMNFLIVNGGVILPQYGGKILSGKVLLENAEIESVVPFERAKRVAMLFQNPNRQFAMKTVFSQFVFALENLQLDHQEIEERINDALKRFELEDFKDRNLQELSGGEQQRKIGRAHV